MNTDQIILPRKGTEGAKLLRWGVGEALNSILKINPESLGPQLADVANQLKRDEEHNQDSEKNGEGELQQPPINLFGKYHLQRDCQNGCKKNPKQKHQRNGNPQQDLAVCFRSRELDVVDSHARVRSAPNREHTSARRLLKA
ncbi:MAG: hypothetical protein MUF81_11580 [Verrucomicrobia bacterium]|nr:hypothetical protein [Verrucomicrobiota bacterium]